MPGLIIVFVGTYVALVAVCSSLERRRQRREHVVATERDRARARILLHRTTRERQLAQLEHDLERRADDRLWRWDHGQWGEWS